MNHSMKTLAAIAVGNASDASDGTKAQRRDAQ